MVPAAVTARKNKSARISHPHISSTKSCLLYTSFGHLLDRKALAVYQLTQGFNCLFLKLYERFHFRLRHSGITFLFTGSYYTGNPAEKRIPCHTLIVILTERKCGKQIFFAGGYHGKMLCFPHAGGNPEKMGTVIRLFS